MKTWHPQLRSYTDSLQNDKVPGTATVEGGTLPGRHVEALTELRTVPEVSVNITHELLLRSMRKFRGAPAIGSRPLLKTDGESKKVKKRDGDH